MSRVDINYHDPSRSTGDRFIKAFTTEDTEVHGGKTNSIYRDERDTQKTGLEDTTCKT
jgi:hypothetical protein